MQRGLQTELMLIMLAAIKRLVLSVKMIFKENSARQRRPMFGSEAAARFFCLPEQDCREKLSLVIKPDIQLSSFLV